MKESKNILLTFDFELFLGKKSGTVENCMLKPTEHLLEIIAKHKLSTVFFVDTLYLFRLKNVAREYESAQKDYNQILELLRKVIDSGGYIFHHLHPHWLDAVYHSDSNEWDVSNNDRFALCNLNEPEIEDVFKYSDEIITEIYEGKSKLIFSGFRAGGLYAQPFSDYKRQMSKYNIKLELTVVKNSKGESGNGSRKFDFSTFPDEMIYSFSDDLLVKDEKGEFIEIMMDQFKLKGIQKIINGLYYRRNVNKKSWQRWGDGNGAGNVVRSTKRANRFISEETFSIELMNNYKSKLYTKYLENEDFMHVISHPKFFSPANIIALDRFLTEIKTRYTIKTDVFEIVKNSNVVLW